MSLRCNLALVANKALRNRIILTKLVNAWVIEHSTQSSWDSLIFVNLVMSVMPLTCPKPIKVIFSRWGAPEKCQPNHWDIKSSNPKEALANCGQKAWELCVWEGWQTLLPWITMDPANYCCLWAECVKERYMQYMQYAPISVFNCPCSANAA